MNDELLIMLVAKLVGSGMNNVCADDIGHSILLTDGRGI
jgi:hypothetical protein